MVAAGLALAVASGCRKKEEEAPTSAPLPQGAASVDELSTGLGLARGLDADLAPSSTEWRQALVIDDKRAVLAGEVTGEAVAILTEDAGKTWRSLHAESGGWSAWGVGADGTAVLATGTQAKTRAPPGQRAPIDSARLLFGAGDARALSASSVLFPSADAKGAPPSARSGAPAVLTSTVAAMIVDEGPRRPAIYFGGPPGIEALPPLRPPATEQLVPTPLGRPPMLLSIAGSSLMTRPFPAPNKPLDAAQKVAGLVATPATLAELTQLPACEAGGWSFQRITQGGRPHVLGISPVRSVVFPLPPTTQKGGRMGCGADRIIVETLEPKDKLPSLATCGLDGSCSIDPKGPFRPWPEPHERQLAIAGTTQGAVAVVSARAGERWGLYLAQSLDGGKLFELARAIGEGKGDRGRLGLGTLISFGARTLLLISSDVTGTSRRGWYVMVSDDGGTTWNPP